MFIPLPAVAEASFLPVKPDSILLPSCPTAPILFEELSLQPCWDEDVSCQELESIVTPQLAHRWLFNMLDEHETWWNWVMGPEETAGTYFTSSSAEATFTAGCSTSINEHCSECILPLQKWLRVRWLKRSYQRLKIWADDTISNIRVC